MSVETVRAKAGTDLGTPVHWDEETASLLYVDLAKQHIHRWDSTTNMDHRFHTESSDFIVPRYSSGFVIGSSKCLSYLDWQIKEVTPLVEFGPGREGHITVCKCDASGRLWFGKCEKNQESIYSLERDLTLRRHVNGIHVSGLAWSHSTKVMYYSDSTHRLIGAFDFDINQGTLSNKRIVLNFDGDTETNLGKPCGMCTDQRDKLWVACSGVGKLASLDPLTGSIIETIELPEQWPTSCCFGGPNYDELYVTSRCHAPDEGGTDNSSTGSVFKITNLAVKGIPSPIYKG